MTSDITVYGATGSVGKYVVQYLLEASRINEEPITIVLAGRNKEKLEGIKAGVAGGNCSLDVFVASSNDAAGLIQMAENTKVVVNCAGPFVEYGEHVIAACAKTGTDYLDITGEVYWAADMRQRYGEDAKKSGARIVPMSGFDSIPSDLSVFGAVQALRKARSSAVDVEKATTWHTASGGLNGGTIQSALKMPIDLTNMFMEKGGSFRKGPFLAFDPLSMTHPTDVRFNPEFQETKDNMAIWEWMNQIPSFDQNIGHALSIPFFMAPVNAKVVNASAIGLGYGKSFKYRERLLIANFRLSSMMGVLSAIPGLACLFAVLAFSVVLKFPVVGKMLADYIFPPGSSPPDAMNQACSSEVYAEVASKAASPTRDTNLDFGACHIKFKGDPGNLVTAQCISESALALVHNRSELPERTKDGFGTPAELIGEIILKRFMENKVRPVEITTSVKKDIPTSTSLLC